MAHVGIRAILFDSAFAYGQNLPETLKFSMRNYPVPEPPTLDKIYLLPEKASGWVGERLNVGA